MTPLDTTDLLEDRSLRGPGFCRALSDRIDGFLAEVFEAAEPPAGTALVAVGGYGRREQCPGSDVDVVLVHRPGLDMAEVAERVWYPLWDAGLKLGHQVGTLPQLLQVATEHLDTATSLLAARPVAGDATVAHELAAAALQQWSGRSRRHLDDLQASVAERHARFGEVAFLLEPDLKESRGGLRDVHSLLWVEQATVPILRESESAGLAAAAETLLTVRVELHRLTGQRADRLLLELQDDVAAALDLADADVLMAEVAAAARTIAWTGEGAARRTTRAARRRGPLGAIVNLRRREVAPGLVLDDGRLALTAQADEALPDFTTLVEQAEAQCPDIVTEDARLAVREDLPEAIGFIRTSTQKMDRLINAILQLSRQGRRALAPERLDIAAMVGQIRETLAHRLADADATLEVEGDLPEIVSDRFSIDQILSNLIENAVKYLRPGVPGRIVVRGHCEGSRAVFEIADNGRGIDPRDHARVFDLFRRSGTQDRPGEGIGLATVRALVFRLGGLIDLSSALGEGATFRLSLPLTYASQETVE